MILKWHGQANAVVVVTAVLFLLFSIGLQRARSWRWPGGRHERVHGYARPPSRWCDRSVAFLTGADRRLVRNPRVFGTAIRRCKAAIVLLDAATVWALIGALGVSPPVTGVFASFMIASLFRTIGIVPGGLGTFEATSVLTLRWPASTSQSRSRPPCCSAVSASGCRCCRATGSPVER